MLLVVVAMFFANNANAQQSLNSVGASTNTAFKPKAEALQIAKDQVAYWHVQNIGGPGTPSYNNMVRNAAFFKWFISEVENGTSIANAIEYSLPYASALGGEKETDFTSKTVLNALRQDAIELFKL